MADMEKLLDGLHCRAANFPEKDCSHCHYGIQMGRRWGCDFRRMTEDAATLLKAQEPIRVDPISFGTNGVKKGHCPKCGDRINDYYNMAFCGRCGQAVKWVG